MTKSESLIAQLINLGVSSSEAEEIANDVKRNDARSLYGAMMLRGLWRLVIDESNPLELTRLGSPAIDRLLASGVNSGDLVDAIRETQVALIYNVALLLDWPNEAQEIQDDVELEISVCFREKGGQPLPVNELHSSLERLDPTGRGGEPRSLELRHFQELPVSARSELVELIRSKKFSVAALKWKSLVGGDLQTSLNAVRALQPWLRRMNA